jgi:hypothetical protein
LADLDRKGRLKTGWALGDQIVGICPKENSMHFFLRFSKFWVPKLRSVSITGSEK